MFLGIDLVRRGEEVSRMHKYYVSDNHTFKRLGVLGCISRGINPLVMVGRGVYFCWVRRAHTGDAECQPVVLLSKEELRSGSFVYADALTNGMGEISPRRVPICIARNNDPDNH